MNKKIADLLHKGVTLQLATCADGRPWVATLYYIADELDIYWVSATKRRHSNEIEQNGKVGAAVVIESDPNGHRLGLQLSGIAQRVMDTEEIMRAARLYVDKYRSGEEYYGMISVLNEDHAMYKMTIDSAAIFDSENDQTIERLSFA